ncbi:MAG: serine hydrolase domain-containing protein [Microbacterium pygmaeum]
MSGSRRIAALTAAALLALLVGCSAPTPDPSQAAPPATDAPPALDDATRARLEEEFVAAVDASGMPGAAILVRIGDETWESSTGVGDVRTQEPFDPGAVVRIGSVTKTFVGTVVLELIDDGALSLDDTLEEFIPGVTNGTTITVRNLLNMTSGVWEFTGDADLMGRWSADPLLSWTVDDTIELLKDKPAQFEPGAKVIYTDSNYILLGRIVELITGSTLPEQVAERVLEPLGLMSTAMPSNAETGVPDPHQQGYRPAGDGPTGPDIELSPIREINPEVAWAAGSMTSTLGDLATWSVALAEGDLLSPELQSARVDTDFLDGSNLEYGLALQRFGDFVGHGGAIFGYNTTMMRFPEADATIVVVGNGSSNGSSGTLDVFAVVLQDLFPEQFEGLTS